MRSHHNETSIGILFPGLTKQFEPIHLRHANVRGEKTDWVGFQDSQGLCTARRGMDIEAVTIAAKEILQEIQDHRLIIDYEDVVLDSCALILASRYRQW